MGHTRFADSLAWTGIALEGMSEGLRHRCHDRQEQAQDKHIEKRFLHYGPPILKSCDCQQNGVLAQPPHFQLQSTRNLRGRAAKTARTPIEKSSSERWPRSHLILYCANRSEKRSNIREFLRRKSSDGSERATRSPWSG